MHVTRLMLSLDAAGQRSPNPQCLRNGQEASFKWSQFETLVSQMSKATKLKLKMIGN